jgi:porin
MHFDLEKLVGLDGGSFLVSLSQRDGNSLSQDRVGNDFTIQQVYGGNTFKLVDVAYLQKLMDDRVEVRLGRIATGDDFLVSIYDYIFMQNGFDGNPVGIFFNSPGMTAYPNSAWGALVKVKPTPRTYLMGGVYESDPADREIAHNGADMSFSAPVFAIGEACYQLNGLPGDSRFLGDYKIGGWYDNSSFTDYQTAGYGTPSEMKRGNWGLYSMFDQIVFPFGEASSDRGFGVFGTFEASPDQSVSQIPYFVATGMACRGIFPSRPGDAAAFGILYGDFSSDLRHSEEREELLVPATGVQDYEAVAEFAYKFYFRKRSLLVEPDFQYVMRPGGTGKIADAVVLGCQIGVNF